MEDVVGGSFKLNTGHRIPMIGLGTYKIVGEMVRSVLSRLFGTFILDKNAVEFILKSRYFRVLKGGLCNAVLPACIG